MAKQRYANDSAVVANVLHEMNDLRMLDFDGQHAYQLFSLEGMVSPY